jgi:hypothetical protein
MARRQSSLGFFGIFGRSSDLRLLDRALHAVDLHPALVPEGVKLTIVNLMKDCYGDAEAPEAAYPPVASLFAYCVGGADAHRHVNGPAETARVEERIESAAARGEGLDADLVLLALHARLIQPDVVERFGLSAAPE